MFLHVDTGHATNGCVSVAEPRLRWLLRRLRPRRLLPPRPPRQHLLMRLRPRRHLLLKLPRRRRLPPNPLPTRPTASLTHRSITNSARQLTPKEY